MQSTRLLVVVLTSAALGLMVLLAIGAGASGSSKVLTRSGVTYGGRTSQGRVAWFRLRADRRSIANLHLDWTASRSQCTNGQPMDMPEDLGAENHFPTIKVRHGRFGLTVPEGAGGPDGTGPESFTIAGTVTDTTIRGTFSAKVTINVITGGQYVCTLGPTRFSAVN